MLSACPAFPLKTGAGPITRSSRSADVVRGYDEFTLRHPTQKSSSHHPSSQYSPQEGGLDKIAIGLSLIKWPLELEIRVLGFHVAKENQRR